MNIVNLIGNLGKDNDLKYTSSGTAVLSQSLAVKRNFKNKSSNEYETDWIDLVFYRQSAENFAKFTRKGSKVGIEGRIQMRNYENAQGVKVYVTEVIVNQFHLLESREITEQRPLGNAQGGQQGNYQQNNQYQGNQQQSNQQQNNQYQGNQYQGAQPVEVTGDDLPF